MLTASIVTYHTLHTDLQRLIKCVEQSDVKVLFVIDNSSNDELRDFVSNTPKIRYIHSVNLGYGSAHNVAIKLAMELGGTYHVVLNPDVYWTGDVLGRLSEFMNRTPDCGLVMPKIVYPSGDTQYLCKLLPSPMNLIVRRFIPIKSYQKKHDYMYELHWSGYNSVMEVPSLSGCFMFMRCSVLKQVGGFDERYFMYAEDLDLCRRIGEVSKTIFYPEVSVVHEYEKGSYKNKKLLKYHIKSVIIYFNKWGWFFDRKRIEKNKYCISLIKKLLL
ncbi:glycosyltransferase [Odoribacter lunatus]|uniref:glycosyltransferase n=1 Tax=Odoribacter lunatus TaxID=2941335 RepID=UPI00203C1AD1|nr:glycosyltransferase family 2 protein [Odoribacter lunatus]